MSTTIPATAAHLVIDETIVYKGNGKAQWLIDFLGSDYQTPSSPADARVASLYKLGGRKPRPGQGNAVVPISSLKVDA